MSKCPICGKTTANAKCDICGFDTSRDYEAFPTLTMLPAKLPSRKDFARKYLAQTGKIVPADPALSKDVPRQQAAPARQEKKEAPAANPNYIPAVTPNLERERKPQTVKAERVNKDDTGTKENKPGWKLPALAAAALVTAGILFFSLSGGEKDPCANGHSWNPADCDSPRVCKICGETAGTALGHSWRAADCDSPRTCKNCGETEGSALGHDWTAADCDSPRICKTCGETDGNALGHSWIDATCQNPKTCSVCGEKEGSLGDHVWEDKGSGTPRTCKNCAATDETETQRIMRLAARIGTGGVHTVVIRDNGKAIGDGAPNRSAAYDVDGWTKLTAVSCGDYFTMGLHENGNVSITGADSKGTQTVESWRNITAIAAGDYHAVGLREDGTVVIVAINEDELSSQVTSARLNASLLNSKVTTEKKIVAVAASYDHTVVLYSDGTVFAVGDHSPECDTGSWKNVKAIFAGVHYTIGLQGNGKLLYAGDDDGIKKQVESWKNIVMVGAGDSHIVALTETGEILSTNVWDSFYEKEQSNLDSWYGSNIEVLGAGCRHTVAITANGTILVKGVYRNDGKDYPCNINGSSVR